MAALGATVDGVILGTVGYMSPEQASGGTVDFRSDQFAFGLLVYEMLAGRRAFAHASAVETLWATIREEAVPLTSIRSDIPGALDRVIVQCLRKQPADRFASTRDIVDALDAGGTGLLEGPGPAPTVLLRGEAPVPAPPPCTMAAAIRCHRRFDPDNFAVRVSLAARRFLYDWDWPAAEREFRQLSPDPRVFLGIQYHPTAMFFWARGWPDEAVALVERALRVDPGNLESRIMLGDFLAHAGRLDDAIAYYRAILEIAPADARPLFGLAEVLKRKGDVQGAISTLRKTYELSGDEVGARALAAGRTELDYENAQIAVARARLRYLEELAGERYVSPLDFARLQAQFGERDKAFKYLELALSERSPMVVLLKVDPAWERIRDDARFAASSIGSFAAVEPGRT